MDYDLSVEEEAHADSEFQQAVADGVKQALRESGVQKSSSDSSTALGCMLFAFVMAIGVFLLFGC